MAMSDGEQKRRRESHSGLKNEKHYEWRGKEGVTQIPNGHEVRRSRTERDHSSSIPARNSEAIHKMPSASQATLTSMKSGTSHRRRRRHHEAEDIEQRRRHRSTAKDEAEVYVPPTESTRQTRNTTRRHKEEEASGTSSTDSEDVEVKPRKRKIKIVYIDEGESTLSRPKERRVREDRILREYGEVVEDAIHRSRPPHVRRHSTTDAVAAKHPRRSVSTKDLPSQPRTRPDLRRSNTTASNTPIAKTPYPPSVANTSSKRSTFLGSFFGPSIQSNHEPERQVECLTCLSDDIPRSKSAKLKCGHRMCHACLRRIFKLSVTDPQHMPPKCCTSDHIPLKHVERLFDINFKKNWNRKYQEYTTKNRIYCPGRRCGEWIKPGNIHKEEGRKYGKCGRCKLKVCVLCNGKWHGTKDCPKDDETNALLEAAKKAGWQRCYSCRTMVELKEGCNHMTCRCTAEFCMICGIKWKSCNCPWFNYDAVEADRLNHEADRLNHMRVPRDPEGPDRPQRLRRPRPDTYNDEMNQRQRQERADEELARRLQRMAVTGDNDGYQGGIGDIRGIGNGAGHFMNENYVRAAHNILTGTFDQATAAANYVMGVAQARGRPPPGPLQPRPRQYPPPPAPGNWPPPRPMPAPPPVLRRHTMREQVYNSEQSTPQAERVVPRRTRTDYASEAAVHAPLGSTRQRQPATPAEEPRPSVLAGLGGAGRYANRVGAWRRHVESGAPEEGVLSMP